MDLNSNNITFYNMLRKYGIKNVIVSIDTSILIVAVIMSYKIIPILPLQNKMQLVKDYSQIIITVSAGILAIVIGALAIITSMINDAFLKIVHDSDSYFDFVFPFYLSVVTWIISIFINIIILVSYYIDVSKIDDYKKIIVFLISLSIAFFISGLKGIGDLVCTSIGLGLYRNETIAKK